MTVSAEAADPRFNYTAELKAYVAELFHDEDAAMVAARERMAAEDLPLISIGPDEGRFLAAIATAVSARRALEMGTLAGYSGLWILRGLAPGGELVTVEANERHATIAREVFAAAGEEGRVRVVEGRGADVLPTLAGPFDLIFLDADKESYPDYLDAALRLARPGAAILAHNAYLHGDVVAPDASPRVAAMREFNRRLVDDRRLTSAIVPLRDGMTLSIVGGGGA